MIEVIFQVRKDEFRDHEAVVRELDLVEEENQITHLITLDDAKNSEDILSKLSWFIIFTSHYIRL
jgi:pre-mRNA-splicing factor CWC22